MTQLKDIETQYYGIHHKNLAPLELLLGYIKIVNPLKNSINLKPTKWFSKHFRKNSPNNRPVKVVSTYSQSEQKSTVNESTSFEDDMYGKDQLFNKNMGRNNLDLEISHMHMLNFIQL